MPMLFRIAVLMSGEAAIAATAWWLNTTRRDQGPVLVPLTNGHGLHRMDLTMVVFGLLVATAVLGFPGWSSWARFWGEPARNTGTRPERHPPDAPPRP